MIADVFGRHPSRMTVAIEKMTGRAMLAMARREGHAPAVPKFSNAERLDRVAKRRASVTRLNRPGIPLADLAEAVSREVGWRVTDKDVSCDRAALGLAEGRSSTALPSDTDTAIRTLLADGMPATRIAKLLGVSENAVRRRRREMRAEG